MAAWGYFLANVNLAVDFLKHLDLSKISLATTSPRFGHLADHIPMLCMKAEFISSPNPLLHDDWVIISDLSDASTPAAAILNDRIIPEGAERPHLRRSVALREDISVITVIILYLTQLDDEDLARFYPFWSKTADEITAADLPALLAEYKRLVLLEVQLLHQLRIEQVDKNTSREGPQSSQMIERRSSSPSRDKGGAEKKEKGP